MLTILLSTNVSNFNYLYCLSHLTYWLPQRILASFLTVSLPASCHIFYCHDRKIQVGLDLVFQPFSRSTPSLIVSLVEMPRYQLISGTLDISSLTYIWIFIILVTYASNKLRLHWPEGVGRDEIVNSTGLKATEYELTDYNISQKSRGSKNTGKLIQGCLQNLFFLISRISRIFRSFLCCFSRILDFYLLKIESWMLDLKDE